MFLILYQVASDLLPATLAEVYPQELVSAMINQIPAIMVLLLQTHLGISALI
jgi:hypothetical protein